MECQVYLILSVPNQTAGELYINSENLEDISNYRRELDLDTGIIHISFNTKKGSIERKIFTSYTAGVIVMHFVAKGNESLNFECNLNRKHNCTDEIISNGKNEIQFYVDNGLDAISYTTILLGKNIGGKVFTLGEFLIFEDVKEATLYLSIETSFRSLKYEETCRKRINKAVQIGYNKIKVDHIEDYKKIFGKLEIKLDGEDLSNIPTNIRLEKLKNGNEDIGLLSLHFQYGRYLLVSSSRKGSLPANLQGIWNG